MTELGLFEALSDIDDSYIEEARDFSAKRGGRYLPVFAAASAAVIIIAAALLRPYGEDVGMAELPAELPAETHAETTAETSAELPAETHTKISSEDITSAEFTENDTSADVVATETIFTEDITVTTETFPVTTAEEISPVTTAETTARETSAQSEASVQSETSVQSEASAAEIIHVDSGGGLWLDGIRPEIMVNGRIYYCSGWSFQITAMETPEFTEYGILSDIENTFLPEGYAEYGKISSLTDSEPSEELQIKTDAENLTGTVYTKEGSDAVYAYMKGDIFDGGYVRFVSAELDGGESVYLNGHLYRIYRDSEHIRKNIPSGCAAAGKLRRIDRDIIPSGELESNCLLGMRFPPEGAEIFSDPDDPMHVYIYQRQYWSKGSYDGYLMCEIIE